MFNDHTRTAILIPCFNESATIAKVVHDLRAALPGAVVYVFDNNSTDQTAAFAREAGAVVMREKRKGKGHVVSTMLWKIDADYYLMVDGDDTYPAAAASALLEPLYADEADMVVGQRLSVYSDRAFPRFHVLGNNLVRGTINMIFGSHLTDTMSGFRAFTREVAESMAIVSTGFDVETEMTLQCLYQNFVIREVAVTYGQRPSGSVSKLRTFRDGARVILKILGMFKAYKPLTFFGGMGLCCFMIAAAPALHVALAYWRRGVVENTALAVLAAGLLAIGVMLSAIGITLHTVNARILEMMHALSKQIAKQSVRARAGGESR